MGNACAGERQGFQQIQPASSSNAQLWARAFAHVNERSKSIIIDASQKARGGVRAREIEKWYQEEFNQLTLLSSEWLELLWDTYDVDRSGHMTKDELRQLITDYLQHAQHEIPTELLKLIRTHCREAGLSDQEIEQYLANPDVADAIHSTRSSATQRVDRWLADLDSVVDKMHALLDKDGDGTLTKKEFCAQFPSVCDQVCSLGALKASLVRLSCLGALDAISRDSDYDD